MISLAPFDPYGGPYTPVTVPRRRKRHTRRFFDGQSFEKPACSASDHGGELINQRSVGSIQSMATFEGLWTNALQWGDHGSMEAALCPPPPSVDLGVEVGLPMVFDDWVCVQVWGRLLASGCLR